MYILADNCSDRFYVSHLEKPRENVIRISNVRDDATEFSSWMEAYDRAVLLERFTGEFEWVVVKKDG